MQNNFEIRERTLTQVCSFKKNIRSYWFKCLSRPDKHQNQNNYTLWFIIAIKLKCRTENQQNLSLSD